MDIDLAALKRLPLEKRAELEENLLRQDFTEVEKAEIQRELIAEFSKPEYKRQGERTDLTSTKEFVEVEPRRYENTMQKVAHLFGESEPTVRKRLEVVESGDEHLIAELNRTGRVSGIHRRMKIAAQARVIEQELPPQPQGPFRVIVADPPWSYDNRADDAAHRAANPYPSMPLDDIKALRVGDIAEDDSILWLWTTNAHLPVAFEVIRAWDFEYKTMLTWVKDRMGTGDWLRGQTEHCLMCVKGRPVVTLSNQTTVIHGPLREHSRKPEEFYRMVETLCPGSKLDYFARELRDGWACYGNDTTKFS